MWISNYLTRTHFAIMLTLAAVLHLFGMAVWNLLPRDRVEDIPVRVLNIKLGDGADMVEEAPRMTPAPVAVPVQKSQAVMSAPVIDNTQQPQVTVKPAPVAEATPRQNPTPTPSRYVREKVESKGTSGSELGNNTEATAEVMARYEQAISLWIQQHKIYPEEARSGNLQGEAVIRIRINRSGHILFYALEKKTGEAGLDAALVEMIKSANPVPPVPDDYPAGNLLEFLVPVSFKLQ